MQVKMMVQDRDEAYLFLDATNAPPGCEQFKLVLDNVTFEEIQDERATLWLQSTTELTVVNRETFDFEHDPMETRWPIPTPLICLNVKDFELLMAR